MRFTVKRRTLIAAGALTLATALAATATDLVVKTTAEHRIAAAVGCRLHATGPVTAELTDPLAGLGIVTGDLGAAQVQADEVALDGLTMNVALVLHEITTHHTTSGGTAVATIPYSQLQQHMGLSAAGMTLGTDGTGLTLTGTAAGQPVTVATSVTTTPNSLTITPTTVTLLGRHLPVSTLTSLPGTSRLAAKLAPHTIAIPNLPTGTRVTGARADTAGLNLDITLPPTAEASPATDCSHTGT